MEPQFSVIVIFQDFPQGVGWGAGGPGARAGPAGCEIPAL